TIQQAAQIAGISPAEMVQTLRREAGLSGDFLPDTADTDEEGTETQPAWFDRTKIAVRYDASPVIDSGGAPMQDILRLANELKSGDILELTAPFKPVPIIDLLKSRGLQAWYFEGKTFFMR
ncbi:MAG: hypothetical protein LBE91_02980, partial [Tannerella sp.]|nr:hypothetical protein [Tannerella sp.]